MKTRLCPSCGREHALFYLQDHLGKLKLMMTCDYQVKKVIDRSGYKVSKHFTGDIQLKIEKTILQWEKKRQWREQEIKRLSKLRTIELNLTLPLEV